MKSIVEIYQQLEHYQMILMISMFASVIIITIGLILILFKEKSMLVFIIGLVSFGGCIMGVVVLGDQMTALEYQEKSELLDQAYFLLEEEPTESIIKVKRRERNGITTDRLTVKQEFMVQDGMYVYNVTKVFTRYVYYDESGGRTGGRDAEIPWSHSVETEPKAPLRAYISQK